MKKFILSIAVLFVAISSNAQILYKVSGNGAKGDSYVMGTHHLAPISIINSIEGFNNAINSVDAVYGEIEHSEMNSPTTQQKMMMLAMAPADSTLSKVFTKEQFDSIDNVLKKYSLFVKIFIPTIIKEDIYEKDIFKAFCFGTYRKHCGKRIFRACRYGRCSRS